MAGYGSYYRLGLDVTKQVDFNRVLESALGLGAPTIRVWAGGKNSIETSPEQRLAIIEDAVRIADLAAAANISISLEYHSGTLTDTASSVRNLLSEVTHPNIDFLWQPVPGETVADNLQRLDDVTPRLRYLHVFHWGPTDSQRLSLADGENSWRDYIAAVRRRNRPTWFLLEFVARDSIEQFQADAISLGSWLNQ